MQAIAKAIKQEANTENTGVPLARVFWNSAGASPRFDSEYNIRDAV